MNKVNQDSSTIIGQIDQAKLKKIEPSTYVLEVEGWFLNTLEPLVALQLGLPGTQMVLALRGPLNNLPAKFSALSRSDNSTFKASIPLPARFDQTGLVHFLATLADGVTIAGGLQLPANIETEKVVDTNKLLQKENIYNTELHDYIALQQSKLSAFLNSQETLSFAYYSKPDVSIVIPLFNKAELILECLRSLRQIQGLTYEVILVDNASTDQTRELVQHLVGVKVIHNQTNQHFIHACNQGADLAVGSALLFLNSDTWLSPYSLFHAWQALRADSTIGAVGGRVVSINGQIQESGSIIYADGSAEGYGRGSPAEDCQVMFSREVDYVSGAFLLTHTNIFLSSGKFDLAYYPAYYEDVDYCLRMWDMGYKVIYEPKALVVHLENASSNSEFAKTYQLINREKLLNRNSKKYFSKDQAIPSFERRFAVSSESNKTVLVVDDQIPLSAKGSGFPRSAHLLNALVELDCRVSFLPILPTKENWSEIYDTLNSKIEVIKDCGQSGLLQFLSERQGYYDILIVSRPQNIEFINDLKNKYPHLQWPNYIIYDAEAISATRELTKLAVTKNIVTSPRDKRYVLAKELSIYKSADKILSVSELEALLLRSFGFSNIDILSHALEIQLTEASFAQRDTILSMGPIYEKGTPNHYATEKFLSSIWPILKQQLVGQHKFCHVGKCADTYFKTDKDKAIEFAGQVKELRPYFSKALVFVASHDYSAGIPIKCLEAASYGVPCVISEHLASQLGWQDGQEALVAKDVNEFANKIKLLCSDLALWESIRAVAHKHVQDYYSKQIFLDTLKRIICYQPVKKGFVAVKNDHLNRSQLMTPILNS